LPDWLRDLNADTGTSAAAALPPWLQEDTPAPPLATPPAADVASGDPDMPAWLTGDAAVPPSEEPLPDWLRDLAADQSAASQPPVPAPPAWPEEPAVAAPVPDDVPDWLRDLSDSPAAKPNADTEQLPSWLRADTVTPAEESAPFDAAPSAGETGWMTDTPAAAADDTRDAPEWLHAAERDVSESELAPDTADATPFSLEPPAAEASPPVNTTPSDAAPGWLADLGEAADDAVPAWLAPDAPQPASSSNPLDAPAWLASDVSQPSSQPDALDAPAWLVPDSSNEPVAADRSHVPAWLRDIGAEEAPEPPSAVAPQPAPLEEDIPEWLRAVPPPDTLPPPAAEPAQEAPAVPDDLPSWLHADAAPSDKTPDWLQATAAEAPASDSPTGEALPSWLAASEPEPPAASPAPQEALPAWLTAGEPEPPATPPPAAPQGETLPPWLHDDHGQPLPTATSPGEAGLPEWLRGVSSEPAASEAPPVPEKSNAGSAARNFDWFDEQPAAPASDSDLLGGAELPAWLRAETEPQPEPATVDTRSVDWLTRFGVQDEEVVATAVPATRLAPPRTATRSASQIEATALLRQLAAAPYPAAEPAPTAAPGSLWRRLGLERAIYLLLLLALLAGLLTPNLTVPLQGTPSAPEAAAIFERIDALGPQDVVLVGYEWDARRISELRPLEQAVMRHLIARNARLVLVSTDPQGTLLLYDLRDELTAAAYRQNGEGYLLLGYKPGGELALRTMAQDFQSTLRADFIGNDARVSALATGLDTGRPLASVRDFAMTVVLADDAADVQAWMEQIRPVTAGTDGAPGQPMLFLLPAEAAPIVQPYMTQPDVWSLAGYQGALAYQALRGDVNADVNQAAANLRFATLAFVVLLVAGGFAAVLSKAISRRRSSA
jgi:hypothetical protein